MLASLICSLHQADTGAGAVKPKLWKLLARILPWVACLLGARMVCPSICTLRSMHYIIVAGLLRDSQLSAPEDLGPGCLASILAARMEVSA